MIRGILEAKWALVAANVVCVACSFQAVSGAENGEAAKLLEQASRAAAEGDSAQAVNLASQAIIKDSQAAEAYYLRGREHFRLGKIKQSVADFDKYVALRPGMESRQWERGIAYYYAGEFEKGAKQFELYQTFHDNDVENSTWRYLCMARKVGVDKARAVMLPIKNDRRVPMMEIFNLYRGKLTVEEVLKAAAAGSPNEATLRSRLFYAHLYIGLYYEAAGKHDLAKKYIFLSADKKNGQARVNRYMWDVARIHAQQIREKKEKK